MITTITSQKTQDTQHSTPKRSVEMSDDRLDGMDDRSSSLSDPDEGLDERTTVQMTDSGHKLEQEVDSETETERLERTPQKLGVPHEKDVEKTPSKLAKEVMASVDSPEPADTNDTTATASVENAATPSRKRKRSSSEPSSLSDIDDERPAPKISHSLEHHVDDKDEMRIDNANASSRPSSERDEDNEQRADTNAPEAEQKTVKEGEDESVPIEGTSAPVKRVGRRKKGKGLHGMKLKGSRTVANTASLASGEPSYGSDTNALESGNQQAGEDMEEEEGASLDEESSYENRQTGLDGTTDLPADNKKKGGLDGFGGVDNVYNSYYGELLKQKLAGLEAELELLQGDALTHPEYLLQMRCIDKRRDDKIHEENLLHELQKKALRVKTVAERGTSHSQFFQEVRDIKDKALESCWKDYFALQKDRRSWGADTSDFTMLYNPSRSVQIRQQTARNLEVSLLAGISKHTGFPAAPDMKGLSAADVEHDLSVMGTRKNTVPFTHTASLLAVGNADGATAEAQFLEQNPWANPQHPAHAHAAYQTLQGTPQPTNFVTPAKQVQVTSMTATNGSQSTIDLASNPPSASVPATSSERPQEAAESPLATIKSLPPAASVNKPVTTERISTSHSSSNPPQATAALPAQAAIPGRNSPFGNYPMGMGPLEKASGAKLAA